MLKHRLLLGAGLIALLVGLLWLDEWIDHYPLRVAWLPWTESRDTPPPGVVIFIASLVIAILAARELAGILRDNGIAASKRITAGAAIIGLLVSCLIPSEIDAVSSAAVVGSAAVLVLVGSLLYYSRQKSFEGVVALAGGTLLSFVYLGLMFGFFLAIRREQSAWLLLWVLAVTKACDIGAYFTGKSIGRHKLIPWLSPGKTWEGLIGGIAASMLVAVGGARLLAGEGPTILAAAVAGSLFAFVGQAGDLMESLFKRDAGRKDSSSILPGFGGVLDVFDSPLLVAPVAYWWVEAAM